MNGKPEDLGKHIDDHRSYIQREVRRRADGLVLRKESISDLIQSISRELIEENKNFEYRGEVEFRAWLNRVIHSKVIDKHRYYTAKKRDARQEQALATEIGPTDSTPSQNAIRDEDRDQVTTALQQLPEDYQDVLRLFWFERLPHAEIAHRIGRSEDATRKLLSRAKARLGLAIEHLKKKPD